MLDYSAYTKQAIDPSQSFYGGMQDVMNIQAARAKKEQALAMADAKRAETEKMQKMQQELAAFAERQGNATPQEYAALMVKYPELQKEFQATSEFMNEGQRKESAGQALSVYSSIVTGNIEGAKTQLEKQIDAYEKAGDAQKAGMARALLMQVENNPESAEVATGLYLSHALGEKDFASTFEKLQQTKKERAMLPGEIKKQKAELLQMSIDNGLKGAQTKQVLATTDKLGAETAKIQLEMELMRKNDGKIEPEKKFDAEKKLREEYSTHTKTFRDQREAYRSMKNLPEDGSGDQALVFMFMKTLDPASVVRAEEFDQAIRTSGIDDWAWGIYEKVKSGGLLTPEARAQMLGAARSTVEAAQKQQSTYEKDYRSIAKKYDLDADNILIGGLDEKEEMHKKSNKGGYESAKEEIKSVLGRRQGTRANPGQSQPQSGQVTEYDYEGYTVRVK